MTISGIVTSMEWKPAFPVSEKPLHIALADQIETAIHAGELRPGDRLPTHRRLASHLKVGIGTVTRAYSDARARGLLSGEVGRGTFVLTTVTELTDPAAQPLGSLQIRRDFADALRSALEQIAKRPRLGDTLAKRERGGSYRVREAGSKWFASMGLDSPADRIVSVAGANHGVYAVLASLVKPGEPVLWDELSWPGAIRIGQWLGLDLVGVKMDGQGMVPEALEEASRRTGAKVVMCNPTLQIPTCAVMSEARRRAIAEVCERRDLILIEDEPGLPLFKGEFKPISALIPHRAVCSADPSRLLHPGLRSAYLLLPERLIGPVHSAILGSVGVMPQLDHEVMALWIHDGTSDRLLDLVILDDRERQKLARRFLKGLPFQAQEVDMDLWLELPEWWSAEGFYAEGAKKGALLEPGTVFEVRSNAGAHGVCVHMGGIEMPVLAHSLHVISELYRSRPA